MATLSFFSTVHSNKAATEFSLQTIRQFHPEAKYMLIGDGSHSDYIDLAKEYDCDFYYNHQRLGYPVQPYGYRTDNMLEWLRRFYIACLQSNTTHIMMVEDDVVLVDKVTVEDEWEVAGHDIRGGNFIPDPLLDLCGEISGVRPVTNFYGSGGGAIYKVQTILDNFDMLYKFFEKNLYTIQETVYPTLGWLDCFTTFCFYLCGKPYTANPHLYNIFPSSRTFDLDFLKGKYQIAHGYIKYYA